MTHSHCHWTHSHHSVERSEKDIQLVMRQEETRVLCVRTSDKDIQQNKKKTGLSNRHSNRGNKDSLPVGIS